MQEEFNYVKNINALTLEQKRKFYVLLAHDLTVSIRVIWSDENLTDSAKVEGMRWINEIMHKLVFRIEELHKIGRLEDDSWTEKDFWQMMHDYASENYEIVGEHVGWSIKSSYERCFSV